MPSTTNGSTPSSAVNEWDTAFSVPEYEDWDGEMAMDPYPSWRLRDIDGRLVYMFDYQYEQYLKNLETEEEKVLKEEGRRVHVASWKRNISTNGRFNGHQIFKKMSVILAVCIGDKFK